MHWHALNIKDRSYQAPELQIDEEAAHGECCCDNADERPSLAAWLGGYPERRENLGIEGWVHLEGKTAEACDNPVAGAEVLLAWSADVEMLAKTLFPLSRNGARQTLVDHVPEAFVVVDAHAFSPSNCGRSVASPR